jgi:pimeloyl-ACP methyl ester carboxylesterase
MRARHPDRQGYAERGGVRLSYEVFGEGSPTLLLVPGWTLPARSFKAQVPYLARHYRVVAFDPRGTGGSGRPRGATHYALDEHVADALAVMDVTETASAVLVGKSRGAQTALALAVNHPSRVNGLVAAAPFTPLTPWPPLDAAWSSFQQRRGWRRQVQGLGTVLREARHVARSKSFRLFGRSLAPTEAAKWFNRPSMEADYDAFTEWFVTRVVVNDPYATKQTEDVIGWMRETDGEAAADAFMGDCLRDAEETRKLLAAIECPVLVIHGDRDITVPFEWGATFAELTGGRLVAMPGAGHLPGGRYPVKVNLVLREFVDALVSATLPETVEAPA